MKDFPKQRRRLGHVEFRRARVSDCAKLLRLVQAYYQFDGITFESKTVRAALRKLLRSRSLGIVWIMWNGPEAVGYLMLTFNYDLEFGGLEGIVTDLFVRSEHRRRGLGRHALALVHAYCRSQGIRTVELQVEEHNERALEFYHKMGFRKLSRIVMSRDVQ